MNRPIFGIEPRIPALSISKGPSGPKKRGSSSAAEPQQFSNDHMDLKNSRNRLKSRPKIRRTLQKIAI